MRRATWILVVLAAGCAGGGGSPEPQLGGGGLFVAGHALGILALDGAGSQTAPLLVETTRGVQVVVAAGTVVRDLAGDPLSGSVELVVDDGGGPAGLTVSSDIEGTLRVAVRDGAAGSEVDAQFDPPLEVRVDLEALAADGVWARYGFTASGEFLRGGDTTASGTILDATDLFLGVVPFVDGGPEVLRLERTGTSGLAFTPASARTLADSFVPDLPHVVSFDLLIPIGEAWPLTAVQLTNPLTGQTVAGGLFPGGLLPGTVGRFTSDGIEYAVESVDADQTRTVRVASDFRNVFDYAATITYGATSAPVSGRAAGGSPDEAARSLDDLYVGWIGIQIYDVEDPAQVLAAFLGAMPWWTQVEVVQYLAHPDPGDPNYRIKLHNHPDSTRVLAERLPNGWGATVKDRLVNIDVRRTTNPIVFSNRTLRADDQTYYFTLDPAAGEPVQRFVSDPRSYGEPPVWSPQGNRFAFQMERPGDGVRQIYVHDMATGVTQAATQSALDVWESFAFSPDGGRLAYGDRGTGAIRTVGVDGSDERLVVAPDAPEALLGGLSWSPDGQRLAYADRGAVIYSIQVDGTGRQLLSFGDGGSDTVIRRERPRWSPAGDLLAYTAYDSGDNKDYIHVVRTDGSGGRRLVEASFFDWSPDGATIAFSRAMAAEPGIFVIDADPDGEPAVARLVAATPGGQFDWYAPHFAPDGGSLAWLREIPASGGGGSAWVIYGARVDGTDVRRLTNGEFESVRDLDW